MSGFRSRMTMRCMVQRNASAVDDWGQPGAPGWDDVEEVSCYATVHSSTEVVGAGGVGENSAQVVVLTDMHVYMPEGTDVTPADRLTGITDRQGNTLFPGPFDIKSVDLRPRRLLDVTVRSSR